MYSYLLHLDFQLTCSLQRRYGWVNRWARDHKPIEDSDNPAPYKNYVRAPIEGPTIPLAGLRRTSAKKLMAAQRPERIEAQMPHVIASFKAKGKDPNQLALHTEAVERAWSDIEDCEKDEWIEKSEKSVMREGQDTETLYE